MDPNLADIISNVVANIKSNQITTSKKKHKHCKFSCSVCGKNVNKNQKAIECSNCHLWSHASCNGIGKSEYSKLIEEDDEVPWYCIPCLILANAEIFPFGFLSKIELYDLLGVDLPSQVEQLPSFEVQSKLTNMPNLNSFDLDENVVQMINSKYYKVQDLLKVVTQAQTFSLSMSILEVWLHIMTSYTRFYILQKYHLI